MDFSSMTPLSSRPSSPVKDAEAVLEDLCRRAQQEVLTQPLPTQNHLACQTRYLFAKYKMHGTGHSLRSAITRYFKDNANNYNNRLPFSSPLLPNYQPPLPDLKDSRMVDDDSRHLVRDMPFLVDRKFHIRPDVKLPEGLFEGIERIFRIYQFQAEAMLKHHCEKYGDEAIFRVGVRSLILSRSDTLFESKQAHPLNLDADARLLLLQFYERHPDINAAEKEILARCCRVGVDVIESYWANMTSLRAPYLAMRTVIAARELRKQRQYKEQQALKAQQQQEQEQDQQARTCEAKMVVIRNESENEPEPETEKGKEWEKQAPQLTRDQLIERLLDQRAASMARRKGREDGA